MVDTLTDKWVRFTELNNSSFEIINLGKVQILVINDFLKYPDKLRSLIDELKFNSCLNRFHAKPGKTYFFDPSLNYIYAQPIITTISKIFSCNGVHSPFLSINCFNGNMLSHYNYPHIDANGRNPEVTIAANLGLTKNLKGGTGFWSYRGKINAVDMSLSDLQHQQSFIDKQRENSRLKINKSTELLNINGRGSVLENDDLDDFFKWEQIEDEGDWKLECIAPLDYNSLVLYSALDFHNPYIKPEWYLDDDRISLSAFFDVEPGTLNIDDNNKSSVSNLWKIFRLDAIHNINFD